MQAAGEVVGQVVEAVMGVGGEVSDVPPHIQCLNSLEGVEVKEKASLIEALTAIIGAEIEMANKYKIFAPGGEEELFYAVEETSCIMRQVKSCCPDCAPWKLNMLYTRGGAQEVVYKMNRDATCTCCCFNRPVINVNDAHTQNKIGSIRDPCACCDLTFQVRDPNDDPVLKVRGGCCQWGLCCPLPCGPCAEVNFDIQDYKTGADVGHLKKKVPGCCKWLVAPDVDNYKIQFGGVQNPEYKVLMIALAIFIDFRYFNDNSNDDGGGMLGDVMDAVGDE